MLAARGRKKSITGEDAGDKLLYWKIFSLFRFVTQTSLLAFIYSAFMILF